MGPRERRDSQSQNESKHKFGYWTLREAFWDGSFMGVLPKIHSVSICSGLRDLLDKPNAFAEDQRRIGRDMRIVINSVSNDLENYRNGGN